MRHGEDEEVGNEASQDSLAQPMQRKMAPEGATHTTQNASTVLSARLLASKAISSSHIGLAAVGSAAA